MPRSKLALFQLYQEHLLQKKFHKQTAPYKTNDKKERPCLMCGKDHTHNNAFCSAKCFKDYTQKSE